MQKLTLKKIAKELDVSISTVSKALRDSHEISKDTRDKIKAFAKLYNYKPNNIALSLKNRKTKTLGVIIPEIVHHFFTTVISGIEKVANERGYNVIIGLSNESFTKEVINMEMLANGSIDGFILSVSKETQLLKDYHHLTETIDQGMPIVMFDRAIKEIGCDKVIVDDVEGARKAVNKLVSLGCKNIGIITTKDYVSVGKLRTTGYLTALTESNLPLNENFILKLNDELNEEAHMDLLEQEIQLLLKNNPEIDGIFAVNEIYALSAMKEALKLGKSIPKDIKVIGFTDGVLSKYATPGLTSVSQHGKQIGEKAADLLIDRLENDHVEPPFQTVVIETELIERASTSEI
ncbi:LacI family DNA-binding transcriptional regulator [Ulvibacter litoralis]|uniref:LacI family transcriptional regulator n=1 Tax=Ulvibacter litoralis TaxID=227084 RepID=A0A1G7HD42_9FLAO|nr:LacI family DNA-binding transcriptional regulator [Ulvibacter litoralis]GHC57337.1 LacI family transcriptional regulator [Ulvibacter litoralis]SDE98276.1 LacI family transcriptional regulator [Ulvibacter litoralis]